MAMRPGDVTGQRFTATFTIANPITSNQFHTNEAGAILGATAPNIMTSTLTINGTTITFANGTWGENLDSRGQTSLDGGTYLSNAYVVSPDVGLYT